MWDKFLIPIITGTVATVVGGIILFRLTMPPSSDVTPTRIAQVTATIELPIITTIPTALPANTPIPTLRPTSTLTLAPTNIPTITPVPPTRTPTPSPTPLPGSTKVSADGTSMVFVPAGEFLMGSSNADMEAIYREKPQHTVYLDAFWIDKYEVTNAQYKKCVDVRKCTKPSNERSFTRITYYGDPNYDNYPVINVWWNDARTFCEWIGKRLPTEAEWEKAARGTDGRIYPWGSIWDGTKLNYCDRNCQFDWKDKNSNDGYVDTAPVGSYSNNISPYGAMDMAGNVEEWTADWFDDYFYSNYPSRNPSGPTLGQYRVLRGGSWQDDATKVRVAFRIGAIQDYWGVDVGFRCAQ
jgi:formylglycine-generating enzyme required for sulfatase activity